MSEHGDMLNIREVGVFFGGKERPLDESTVYRWIRQGKLPRGIRIGGRTLRWRKTDLAALLASWERASAQKAGE